MRRVVKRRTTGLLVGIVSLSAIAALPLAADAAPDSNCGKSVGAAIGQGTEPDTSYEGDRAANDLAEVLRPYEKELIGSYPDGDSKSEFNVVVSKSSEVSGAIVAAVARNKGSLRVSVVRSCREKSELVGVERSLAARWGQSGFPTTFTTAVDPESETVSVAVTTESGAAVIRELFGELVTVRVTDIARVSREYDLAPHYGGARMVRFDGNAACSSGFKVKRADGTVGMVTAAHCGPAQSQWRAINDSTGATDFFGTMTVRGAFPNRDTAFLTGSSYSHRVYAQPDMTWRNVVGDRNVNNNEGVCFSGYVTQQLCGIVVSNPSTTFCDADGCTTAVAAGNIPGLPGILRHGDSGGPVYSKNAPDIATVHGTLVGGSDPDSQGAFKIAYWQNVGAIKSELNVTVMTN